MQPLAALLLFAAFLAVYVRLLLTGVTRADTGTVGPTARAA
jgi:hypothetical protein